MIKKTSKTTTKTKNTNATTRSTKKRLVSSASPQVKAPELEFKPGNTPHLQYGKEVLNANVDWSGLVSEILSKRYDKSRIAQYAQCEPTLIDDILSEKYDGLNFRTGARLVTLHYKTNPMCY